MNWSGKVAVVTGAAQGMGAAQARLLLERGAIVYAIDKAEITEWPGTQPGLLVPYRMDVTEPPAWDELAATLAARSEPLVALVNNAGVTFRRSVTETTPAEWAFVLGVNLTGPYLGIRALAPLMPPGGAIVNIGSVAGHSGYFAAAYSASKWGVRGLTRAAALELVHAAGRSNSVSRSCGKRLASHGPLEGFGESTVEVCDEGF
ncbi:MAG: SDR family oxidoreductase, partial [Roseiarcus sp.]